MVVKRVWKAADCAVARSTPESFCDTCTVTLAAAPGTLPALKVGVGVATGATTGGEDLGTMDVTATEGAMVGATVGNGLNGWPRQLY